MAKKLTAVTTPDGVTHDPVFILGKLEISHGVDLLPTPKNDERRRSFRFLATVQAFHSLDAIKAGAVPVEALSKRAAGADEEYFQFAAMPIAGLFPEGTDLKSLTVGDMIDAMGWAAVKAKNPGRFDAAETVTIGRTPFTDPSVSRIVKV